MNKYGYARVSTTGQTLDSQIKDLKREGVEVANIVSEHYTGTKMDRPKFTKLIKKLKSGDTLVITKLDRFARSTIDGVKIIRELFERGVRVHVINMGLLEDTSVGRLMINMLISVAEFERDMIIERTQAGRKLALEKDPNKKMGGPNRKWTKQQMDKAFDLMAQGNSVKEVAELIGVSKHTIYREKANRQAKTDFNKDFERLAE